MFGDIIINLSALLLFFVILTLSRPPNQGRADAAFTTYEHALFSYIGLSRPPPTRWGSRMAFTMYWSVHII